MFAYMLQVNVTPVDLALNARFPYSYWSISDKKTYCEPPDELMTRFSSFLTYHSSWNRGAFEI
jgi:hypothetical protein